MRCSLLLLAGMLSGTLWAAPHAAHAQIANTDFEGRNAVPSTRSNLGPRVVVNSTTYYDDLQVWDAIPTHRSFGLNGSSVTTTYENGGSYLSTDGTGDGNLSVFGVAPHSGSSAVLIQQHDENADHNYDQFVTQRLASTLQAGHRYEAKFWALRTQPSVNFRTKLALYVTSSSSYGSPYYDLVDGSPTKYSIIPSANAKVVVSGDIQANQGWVLVSGFINIPAGENTNQWVTIGYDRSDQYRDTSLPTTVTNASIGYLIDDVSLTDMGCVAPTLTYGLDLNTDNTCGDKTVRFTVSAEDRANNPGATFELTATGSNYVLTYGSADHSSCNIRIRNQSSFNVLATGTNVCGTGPVFDTGTFTGRSFLDGCFTNATQSPTAATAYPNPATESMTMPQSAEQAVLLNSQGKAVQKPDASGKLRVQDLPAGLYNLQMRQNGKLINQRIEVKH